MKATADYLFSWKLVPPLRCECYLNYSVDPVVLTLLPVLLYCKQRRRTTSRPIFIRSRVSPRLSHLMNPAVFSLPVSGEAFCRFKYRLKRKPIRHYLFRPNGHCPSSVHTSDLASAEYWSRVIPRAFYFKLYFNISVHFTKLINESFRFFIAAPLSMGETISSPLRSIF